MKSSKSLLRQHTAPNAPKFRLVNNLIPWAGLATLRQTFVLCRQCWKSPQPDVPGRAMTLRFVQLRDVGDDHVPRDRHERANRYGRLMLANKWAEWSPPDPTAPTRTQTNGPHEIAHHSDE